MMDVVAAMRTTRREGNASIRYAAAVGIEAEHVLDVAAVIAVVGKRPVRSNGRGQPGDPVAAIPLD